ncbi:MAG: bifunctional phosphopantothenoylcysteine decarboxylase/phosphopantothenate--cysteine ligase CoaBC [Ignavibacteriales bacterium]|nr:bifunctional phosphopantothenoylcysteine decarboxylase/phosphopantothenate--cysteine ligase CoaBC [Ignavibacteriales bacterium]
MIYDPLRNKKIILGVTGGIAAYKSCLLIRSLVNRGAEVRVIMTPSALQFIAPLTLSTLSGNAVIVNIFPETQKNGVDLKTWHIEYALWADLMIIAPATTNTIAKIVHGFCDNALTTVVSALRCPLIVAPAADIDMYSNKIAQANFNKLKEDVGAYIVEAEKGNLASGLSGIGRMADVNKIVDASEIILSGYNQDLLNKKILVTAGPTYEDIDPVRYIGNRSSGKMGYSIAKAAFLRGAEVTLISGPSSENIYQEINLIQVRSAKEMLNAVKQNLENNSALIMSAAVADYTPLVKAETKIKKEENLSSIKLKKTEDILGSLKNNNKKIVGFALETDNQLNNAKKKLAEKNLDIIVLNSVSADNCAFESDTNKITVIHKSGETKEFSSMSKFMAANEILSELIKIL